MRSRTSIRRVVGVGTAATLLAAGALVLGTAGPAGAVDNPPTCDGMVTGNAGEDLAKAMGVCTKASEAGYGLVSATITRGNGQ